MYLFSANNNGIVMCVSMPIELLLVYQVGVYAHTENFFFIITKSI